MVSHPDDIARYIRLTESSSLSSDNQPMPYDEIQVVTLDESSLLVEDINDMIFKLRSYGETDSNLDYARGVEEGLALAANMLDRLLERHSGHSNK